MSTASISYSSLKGAAAEARNVARKLSSYATSLDSTVYRKLNDYDGVWTESITAARSRTDTKISELREMAGKYHNYADELDALESECDSVDIAVRSKVSSLTASFKAAHGIENNAVVNVIGYILTSIGNSSSAGRWLNEKKDQIDRGIDYLKQSIEDLYDYGGGKQFLQGIAVAALKFAIAVMEIAKVIAMIAAGSVVGPWAWIVAIAGLAGGAIALVDEIANWVNEVRALGCVSDDPATAKRRSDTNTVSDTIRTESDSEFWHYFADGLDVAAFTCAAIGLVDGIVKFASKGIKWIKQIDFKKIFSKASFSNLSELGELFKQGDMKTFDFLKRSFVKNLKGEYLKFTDLNGKFDLANTLSSVKNMLKIPKDLIEGGFSPGNIASVFLKKIVFTGINIDEVIGSLEKGGKLMNTFEGLFDHGYADLDIHIPEVVIKLNQSQPVSVKVPAITVPNLNVGYTQVA